MSVIKTTSLFGRFAPISIIDAQRQILVYLMGVAREAGDHVWLALLQNMLIVAERDEERRGGG